MPASKFLNGLSHRHGAAKRPRVGIRGCLMALSSVSVPPRHSLDAGTRLEGCSQGGSASWASRVCECIEPKFGGAPASLGSRPASSS